MKQTVKILKRDPDYEGVWKVRVPGIYGSKGDPLPKRMSRLVLPAAKALKQAYGMITAEGGHLYISDMFRSAKAQQRAHEDWKSGRKSAYSPPPCASVHEAARAIDIDAFDTGIGHARVREILKACGWTAIVETLTGPECWHYEFREDLWEAYREAHGYPAMARAMKEEIGNLRALPRAKKQAREIRWLQASLNQILGLHLAVDGIFGDKTRAAVAQFQTEQGLQVDGIPGPITRARLQEILQQS